MTLEVDDQGGPGGQPVGDDRPDDPDGGATTDEPIDDALVDLGTEPPATVTVPWLDRVGRRAAEIHPAAWLTLAGAVIFAWVFGRLGVQHHRNFGTWAFDMGIYDQSFWLVSRGGQSFVTVRGLEFWGHHFNPIAIAFAPFYWLGAGPEFLYVAQAAALGAAAIPTYLIARDRFSNQWMGFVFAVVYLMYAPVQWISWANFHPEALVILPMLFAWWFAMRRSWTPCIVALVVAMSCREDAALAVAIMGFVLWVMFHGGRGERHDKRMAIVIGVLGVTWYAVATKLIIPHFNGGEEPFYIEYFYGRYGGSTTEIAKTILERPDMVVSDATQPDRIRFYRDLLLPWGGVPLAAPLQLLMALPQLLASVIGSSPYARMIRYQYTAVMIAPIVVAAVEGAKLIWRYRFVRLALVPWLLVCAYVTNVAWSPSPLSKNDAVWSVDHPRLEAMRDAVAMVPDDVTVTATYSMLPHLSRREQIYDWPNPWVPSYWGNDDTDRLPDPKIIDYVVIDRTQVGEAQLDLLDRLVGPDGEFEVLMDVDDIVVGRRRDADE
ncbi:MAG TPA: DUF2079 domain-containing protein [Ilumatobacteraceae bacterium]